jgi:hypothetical protein
MSTLASVAKDAPRGRVRPRRKPAVISADDARQGPAGHEVLYVLGLGTSGAIFAVAVVLTYFELFRA